MRFRYLLFVGVLLVLLPARAYAQEDDQLDNPSMPEGLDLAKLVRPDALLLPPATVWPAEPTAPLPKFHASFDRRLKGLAVGEITAMITDTESTFSVLARCPKHCPEGNPYVKPFIERGRVVTYLAAAGVEAGVISLSAAMRTHHNPAIRAVWWVPMTALILAHVQAIHSNLKVPMDFR